MLPNQNSSFGDLPAGAVASIKIVIKTVKVSYIVKGLHKSTSISSTTTTSRMINLAPEKEEVLASVN
ncbi:hypothetical protein MCEJIRE27_00498 [Candidatus Nanopelagicaceae bacterium]